MFTFQGYINAFLAELQKTYAQASLLESDKEKLIHSIKGSFWSRAFYKEGNKAEQHRQEIVLIVRRQKIFVEKMIADYEAFKGNLPRIVNIVNRRLNTNSRYFLDLANMLGSLEHEFHQIKEITQKMELSGDFGGFYLHYKTERSVFKNIRSKIEPFIKRGERNSILCKHLRFEKLFMVMLAQKANFASLILFIMVTLSSIPVNVLGETNSDKNRQNMPSLYTEHMQTIIPEIGLGGVTFSTIEIAPQTNPIINPVEHKKGLRLFKKRVGKIPDSHDKRLAGELPEINRMVINLNNLQSVPDTLRPPTPPLGYIYKGSILARVTAYPPIGPGVMAGNAKGAGKGFTQTGRSAFTYDGIAADYSLMPPNTKVLIPSLGGGYGGIKTVDDTGDRLISDNVNWGIYHVDVRVPTKAEADQMGETFRVIHIFIPVTPENLLLASNTKTN